MSKKQDAFYYNNFISCAEYSCKAVHLLKDILTDLLDARKSDPTALATGALAGRIVGNVQITGCDVISPDLYNLNSVTGGFVGYSEGATSYATENLGVLVKLLSGVLNLIPGLGLGDVITILLGNALPLDKLVPTGYESPVLTDCTVTGLSGTVGVSDTKYNGGFTGQIIGTQMIDCDVINSDYTVQAESYGGGFVGLARDAEIKGMLQ